MKKRSTTKNKDVKNHSVNKARNAKYKSINRRCL